jgi:excisionase family DNA binding protein
METSTTGSYLLRVPEACQLAGVGRSTAYELIASGVWPVVRVGKAVRVPRAGLLAWIERMQEGGVEPPSGIAR